MRVPGASATLPPAGVELRCSGAPRAPRVELLRALERRTGAKVEMPDHGVDVLAFRFRGLAPGGAPPPQLIVVPAAPPHTPRDPEPLLRQTWDWPDARQALQATTHTTLISQLLSESLAPWARLDLARAVVAAAVDVIHPTALLWRSSGRVVRPQALLDSLAPGGDPLLGPVNVRSYRSHAGSLLDTLGLGALGATDLEVLDDTLAPQELAPLLFGAARLGLSEPERVRPGERLRDDAGRLWLVGAAASLTSPPRPILRLSRG